MDLSNFWLKSNNGKIYRLEDLKNLSLSDVEKKPKLKKLIQLLDTDGNIQTENSKGENEWQSIFSGLIDAAAGDNILTNSEFELYISKKFPGADITQNDLNELLETASGYRTEDFGENHRVTYKDGNITRATKINSGGNYETLLYEKENDEGFEYYRITSFDGINYVTYIVGKIDEKGDFKQEDILEKNANKIGSKTTLKFSYNDGKLSELEELDQNNNVINTSKYTYTNSTVAKTTKIDDAEQQTIASGVDENGELQGIKEKRVRKNDGSGTIYIYTPEETKIIKVSKMTSDFEYSDSDIISTSTAEVKNDTPDESTVQMQAVHSFMANGCNGELKYDSEPIKAMFETLGKENSPFAKIDDNPPKFAIWSTDEKGREYISQTITIADDISSISYGTALRSEGGDKEYVVTFFDNGQKSSNRQYHFSPNGKFIYTSAKDSKMPELSFRFYPDGSRDVIEFQNGKQNGLSHISKDNKQMYSKFYEWDNNGRIQFTVTNYTKHAEPPEMREKQVVTNSDGNMYYYKKDADGKFTIIDEMRLCDSVPILNENNEVVGHHPVTSMKVTSVEDIQEGNTATFSGRVEDALTYKRKSVRAQLGKGEHFDFSMIDNELRSTAVNSLMQAIDNALMVLESKEAEKGWADASTWLQKGLEHNDFEIVKKFFGEGRLNAIKNLKEQKAKLEKMLNTSYVTETILVKDKNGEPKLDENGNKIYERYLYRANEYDPKLSQKELKKLRVKGADGKVVKNDDIEKFISENYKQNEETFAYLYNDITGRCWNDDEKDRYEKFNQVIQRANYDLKAIYDEYTNNHKGLSESTKGLFAKYCGDKEFDQAKFEEFITQAEASKDKDGNISFMATNVGGAKYAELSSNLVKDTKAQHDINRKLAYDSNLDDYGMVVDLLGMSVEFWAISRVLNLGWKAVKGIASIGKTQKVVRGMQAVKEFSESNRLLGKSLKFIQTYGTMGISGGSNFAAFEGISEICREDYAGQEIDSDKVLHKMYTGALTGMAAPWLSSSWRYILNKIKPYQLGRTEFIESAEKHYLKKSKNGKKALKGTDNAEIINTLKSAPTWTAQPDSKLWREFIPECITFGIASSGVQILDGVEVRENIRKAREDNPLLAKYTDEELEKMSNTDIMRAMLNMQGVETDGKSDSEIYALYSWTEFKNQFEGLGRLKIAESIVGMFLSKGKMPTGAMGKRTKALEFTPKTKDGKVFWYEKSQPDKPLTAEEMTSMTEQAMAYDAFESKIRNRFNDYKDRPMSGREFTNYLNGKEASEPDVNGVNDGLSIIIRSDKYEITTSDGKTTTVDNLEDVLDIYNREYTAHRDELINAIADEYGIPEEARERFNMMLRSPYTENINLTETLERARSKNTEGTNNEISNGVNTATGKEIITNNRNKAALDAKVKSAAESYTKDNLPKAIEQSVAEAEILTNQATDVTIETGKLSVNPSKINGSELIREFENILSTNAHLLDNNTVVRMTDNGYLVRKVNKNNQYVIEKPGNNIYGIDTKITYDKEGNILELIKVETNSDGSVTQSKIKYKNNKPVEITEINNFRGTINGEEGETTKYIVNTENNTIETVLNKGTNNSEITVITSNDGLNLSSVPGSVSFRRTKARLNRGSAFLNEYIFPDGTKTTIEQNTKNEIIKIRNDGKAFINDKEVSLEEAKQRSDFERFRIQTETAVDTGLEQKFAGTVPKGYVLDKTTHQPVKVNPEKIVMTTKDGIIQLKDERDNLLGVAEFYIDEDQLYLSALGSYADGLNIGTTLVQELIKIANVRGVKIVGQAEHAPGFGSLQKNPTNLKFYYKMGFRAKDSEIDKIIRECIDKNLDIPMSLNRSVEIEYVGKTASHEIERTAESGSNTNGTEVSTQQDAPELWKQILINVPSGGKVQKNFGKDNNSGHDTILDKNGNVIQKVTYKDRKNNIIATVETKTFDTNGNCTCKKMYADGELCAQYDYEYDKNGNKTKEVLKEEGNISFTLLWEYNENNQKIKSKFIQNNCIKITEYEYDNNNEIIKEKHYVNDELVSETSYEPGKLTKTYNVKNDELEVKDKDGTYTIPEYKAKGKSDARPEYKTNSYKTVIEKIDSAKTLADFYINEMNYHENVREEIEKLSPKEVENIRKILEMADNALTDKNVTNTETEFTEFARKLFYDYGFENSETLLKILTEPAAKDNLIDNNTIENRFDYLLKIENKDSCKRLIDLMKFSTTSDNPVLRNIDNILHIASKKDDLNDYIDCFEWKDKDGNFVINSQNISDFDINVKSIMDTYPSVKSPEMVEICRRIIDRNAVGYLSGVLSEEPNLPPQEIEHKTLIRCANSIVSTYKPDRTLYENTKEGQKEYESDVRYYNFLKEYVEKGSIEDLYVFLNDNVFINIYNTRKFTSSAEDKAILEQKHKKQNETRRALYENNTENLRRDIELSLESIRDKKISDIVYNKLQDIDANPSITRDAKVKQYNEIQQIIDICNNLTGEYSTLINRNQEIPYYREFLDYINSNEPGAVKEITKSYSKLESKFRQFVSYIKENYPKIAKIFDNKYVDTILGLFRKNYKDVCKDFEEEVRIHVLREYCKVNNDELADYLYTEFYLKTTPVPENIKKQCLNIHKKYGVKVFVPLSAKDSNVLDFVDKEFDTWNKISEGQAKYPPTLDFLQTKRDYEEETDDGWVQGFHESYNNAISINGFDLEVAKQALRHEMTHRNDNRLLQKFPDGVVSYKLIKGKNGETKSVVDLKNCRFVEEFRNAGIKEDHIRYAYKNVREFIAVASEGDMSKYSPEMKKLLLDIGMPEWMFNTQSHDKINEQEAKVKEKMESWLEPGQFHDIKIYEFRDIFKLIPEITEDSENTQRHLDHVKIIFEADMTNGSQVIGKNGYLTSKEGADAFDYLAQRLRAKRIDNYRSPLDLALSHLTVEQFYKAKERGLLDKINNETSREDINEIERYVKMTDEEFENYGKYNGKINYVSKNEDINRLSLKYPDYEMENYIESRIIHQMKNNPQKIKEFVDKLIELNDADKVSLILSTADMNYTLENISGIKEMFDSCEPIEIDYAESNMKSNIKIAYDIYQLARFNKTQFLKIMQLMNYGNQDFISKLAKDTTIDEVEIYNIIKTTERNFILEDSDEKIPYSEYLELYKILKSLSRQQKISCKNAGFDVDAKIAKLKTIIESEKDIIKTTPEQQKKFAHSLYANNNPVQENILKNFDFSQFGNKGLPLKYTREEFNNKINELLKDLPENEQNIILNHFGIEKGHDGFDGLINNRSVDNLQISDRAKEVGRKIITEIENFTTKNEVLVEDKEAKEILDGIIQGMPEFTAIIGKQQHETHQYSVDIHTLKVLQSAMKEPAYEKLSDEDKTVLKTVILLHDIAKKGAQDDSGHAEVSTVYADNILKQMPFTDETRRRITDLIKNHHWFAGYNKGEISADEVALNCRRNSDWEIMKIFAKADLTNVNNNLHYIVLGIRTKSMSDFEERFNELIRPIEESREKFNAMGAPVYLTKVNQRGKFFDSEERIFKDGTKTIARVFNLGNMKSNTPIEEYGFERGTTAGDLKIMTSLSTGQSSLEGVVSALYNPKTDTEVSARLTDKNNNNNFQELIFGIVVNSGISNIIQASKADLFTKHQKSIKDMLDHLNNVSESTLVKYNNAPKEAIKKALEGDNISLSEKEYSKLCDVLFEKPFESHIKDIKINGKTIKAATIKKALDAAREDLVNSVENEFTIRNATVTALYAKVKSLDDCPDWFIKLAEKYDLPIILNGETTRYEIPVPDKFSHTRGEVKTNRKSEVNAKLRADTQAEPEEIIIPPLTEEGRKARIEKLDRLVISSAAAKKADSKIFDIITKIKTGNEVSEQELSAVKDDISKVANPTEKQVLELMFNAVTKNKKCSEISDEEFAAITNHIIRQYEIEDEEIKTHLLDKSTGATEIGRFNSRIKSDTSLFDKIYNYAKKHPDESFINAIDDVRDCWAGRFVLEDLAPQNYEGNPSDAARETLDIVNVKLKEFMSKLINSEIVDMEVYRVSNYTDKDNVGIYSDSDIWELEEAAKAQRLPVVKNKTITTKMQGSAYPAFQINIKTKSGRIIELQFRFKAVDDYAEAEHLIYDLLSIKDIIGRKDELSVVYEPFKKILKENLSSDEAKAKYQEYTRAEYQYRFYKALGIEIEKPKLEDYTVNGKPFNKLLSGDNLIKIHHIADGLKKKSISKEEALKQFNELEGSDNAAQSVTQTSLSETHTEILNRHQKVNATKEVSDSLRELLTKAENEPNSDNIFVKYIQTCDELFNAKDQNAKTEIINRLNNIGSEIEKEVAAGKLTEADMMNFIAVNEYFALVNSFEAGKKVTENHSDEVADRLKEMVTKVENQDPIEDDIFENYIRKCNELLNVSDYEAYESLLSKLNAEIEGIKNLVESSEPNETTLKNFYAIALHFQNVSSKVDNNIRIKNDWVNNRAVNNAGGNDKENIPENGAESDGMKPNLTNWNNNFHYRFSQSELDALAQVVKTYDELEVADKIIKSLRVPERGMSKSSEIVNHTISLISLIQKYPDIEPELITNLLNNPEIKIAHTSGFLANADKLSFYIKDILKLSAKYPKYQTEILKELGRPEDIHELKNVKSALENPKFENIADVVGVKEALNDCKSGLGVIPHQKYTELNKVLFGEENPKITELKNEFEQRTGKKLFIDNNISYEQTKEYTSVIEKAVQRFEAAGEKLPKEIYISTLLGERTSGLYWVEYPEAVAVMPMKNLEDFKHTLFHEGVHSGDKYTNDARILRRLEVGTIFMKNPDGSFALDKNGYPETSVDKERANNLISFTKKYISEYSSSDIGEFKAEFGAMLLEDKIKITNVEYKNGKPECEVKLQEPYTNRNGEELKLTEEDKENIRKLADYYLELEGKTYNIPDSPDNTPEGTTDHAAQETESSSDISTARKLLSSAGYEISRGINRGKRAASYVADKAKAAVKKGKKVVKGLSNLKDYALLSTKLKRMGLDDRFHRDDVIKYLSNSNYESEYVRSSIIKSIKTLKQLKVKDNDINDILYQLETIENGERIFNQRSLDILSELTALYDKTGTEWNDFTCRTIMSHYFDKPDETLKFIKDLNYAAERGYGIEDARHMVAIGIRDKEGFDIYDDIYESPITEKHVGGLGREYTAIEFFKACCDSNGKINNDNWKLLQEFANECENLGLHRPEDAFKDLKNDDIEITKYNLKEYLDAKKAGKSITSIENCIKSDGRFDASLIDNTRKATQLGVDAQHLKNADGTYNQNAISYTQALKDAGFDSNNLNNILIVARQAAVKLKLKGEIYSKDVIDKAIKLKKQGINDSIIYQILNAFARKGNIQTEKIELIIPLAKYLKEEDSLFFQQYILPVLDFSNKEQKQSMINSMARLIKNGFNAYDIYTIGIFSREGALGNTVPDDVIDAAIKLKQNKFEAFNIEKALKLSTKQDGTINDKTLNKFIELKNNDLNQYRISDVIEVCVNDRGDYIEENIDIYFNLENELKGSPVCRLENNNSTIANILINACKTPDGKINKKLLDENKKLLPGIYNNLSEDNQISFIYLLNQSITPDGRIDKRLFEVLKELETIDDNCHYPNFPTIAGACYKACKDADGNFSEEKYNDALTLMKKHRVDRHSVSYQLEPYEDFKAYAGKDNVYDLSLKEKRQLQMLLLKYNHKIDTISDINKIIKSGLIPKTDKDYARIMRQLSQSLGQTDYVLDAQAQNQMKQDITSLTKELSAAQSIGDIKISQTYDELLKQIQSKMSGMAESEKRKIYDYFGFTIKDGKIIGFPTVSGKNIEYADITNSFSRKVVDAVTKVINDFHKNSAITVEGNPELSRILTSLSKTVPEIMNKFSNPTVAKQTLENLQRISQSPEYGKLSENDKNILVIAGLLKDTNIGNLRETAYHIHTLSSKFNWTKIEREKLYNLLIVPERIEEYNNSNPDKIISRYIRYTTIESNEREEALDMFAFTVKDRNVDKMTYLMYAEDISGELKTELEKRIREIKKDDFILPQLSMEEIAKYAVTEEHKGHKVKVVHAEDVPDLYVYVHTPEAGIINHLSRTTKISNFDEFQNIDNDGVVCASFVSSTQFGAFQKHGLFFMVPAGHEYVGYSHDITSIGKDTRVMIAEYYRNKGMKAAQGKGLKFSHRTYVATKLKDALHITEHLYSDLLKEKQNLLKQMKEIGDKNSPEYLELKNKVANINKEIKKIDDDYVARQDKIKEECQTPQIGIADIRRIDPVMAKAYEDFLSITNKDYNTDGLMRKDYWNEVLVNGMVVGGEYTADIDNMPEEYLIKAENEGSVIIDFSGSNQTRPNPTNNP